jgi:hypothetical protein
MGLQQRACFSVPAYKNVNPKGLVLYVGNGASGSYYPNALGAGDRPLPAGPQACVDFTVSRGVAAGPYTMALEDSSSGSLFATVSFAADSASITVADYSVAAAGLVLTVRWRVPAARATARDQVKLYGPRGDVVHWFYTSCGCQAAPGRAASPGGAHRVRLGRDPKARGSFLAKLHPAYGGEQRAAAVAPDWIPWRKLGW